MFSAGTRVSVHSSNISGKKLGPKPYSLGYVSSANQTYFLKYVKDFPIKNQSFTVTPITIVCTRYGREQRRRSELRKFLHIMPVFLGSAGIELRSRITEVLSVLSSGELNKNGWWGEAQRNYGCNSMGVLLPTRHNKVQVMDAEELKSWAFSILRSSDFVFAIKKNANLPTLQALTAGQPQLFNWVIKACKSSDSRYALLSWAAESKANTQAFVQFIRAASACVSKRLVENAITSMEQYLKSHYDSVKNDAFVSWFMSDMFESSRIMNRKHKIVTASKLPSALKEMADCMRLVHSTFLSIKPKYL